jgi:tungstate transport system substrate-binding protein
MIMKLKKMVKGICLAALTAWIFLGWPGRLNSVYAKDVQSIICASTTSMQNTGLFEYLLPHFTRKTGIEVKVIAVGTGQALAMGERGDADVLLVHSPEAEEAFINAGHGLKRNPVMYNDFVILGNGEDKAGIRGMKQATAAFAAIGSKGVPFLSRGDDSGTHQKELKLWAKAGIDPKGKPWYLESGQGMAGTIRIADERKAYTLSDRGTWLSMKDKGKMELEILLEGDPQLFNQYSVIVVNPERHPKVKAEQARIFADWLVSEEGQKLIGAFKDAFGNRLFQPNARHP